MCILVIGTASNQTLTNAHLLSNGPLGTNFSEIRIVIQNFSFLKMHLKMLSVKWQPFCAGEGVLIHCKSIGGRVSVDKPFVFQVLIAIEAEWRIYAWVNLPSLVQIMTCRLVGAKSTNVWILLIGPIGTNISEILIKICTFSFKKMHLKMSSGIWQPSCLGLDELTPSVMENWSTWPFCFNAGIPTSTSPFYWELGSNR